MRTLFRTEGRSTIRHAPSRKWSVWVLLDVNLLECSLEDRMILLVVSLPSSVGIDWQANVGSFFDLSVKLMHGSWLYSTQHGVHTHIGNIYGVRVEWNVEGDERRLLRLTKAMSEGSSWVVMMKMARIGHI